MSGVKGKCRAIVWNGEKLNSACGKPRKGYRLWQETQVPVCGHHLRPESVMFEAEPGRYRRAYKRFRD